METVALVAQLIIAFGIFNVWMLRFRRSTNYRPGSARNMQEEFSAYGLPSWSVYLIGGIKIVLATLLVIGIWIPEVVWPSAIGMAVLMAGAIAMHLKVKDTAKKALPASILLGLSLLVALLAH